MPVSCTAYRGSEATSLGQDIAPISGGVGLPKELEVSYQPRSTFKTAEAPGEHFSAPYPGPVLVSLLTCSNKLLGCNPLAD